MRRSTNGFLTTHVGSLPRPDDLLAMMIDRQGGREVDKSAFSARVTRAVDEIVAKQANLGIDVINDGEQGKVSFVTYVHDRLTGIVAGEPRGNPAAKSVMRQAPSTAQSSTTACSPSMMRITTSG